MLGQKKMANKENRWELVYMVHDDILVGLGNRRYLCRAVSIWLVDYSSVYHPKLM